uniref:Uncharacterized protein n=1 Tax=Aegilops tauschii subsp. strangulata TaxID=200361 RepID=A0A453FTM7_AEGTS
DQLTRSVFMLGQVIGNKWDHYLDLLQADYTEGKTKKQKLMMTVIFIAYDCIIFSYYRTQRGT